MTEIYWYGGANNHQGQWDFEGIAPFNLDAGGKATDAGTGLAGLPATAHGLLAGDSITIAGPDNFDGTYVLDSETTDNLLVIPVPLIVLSGSNSIVAGNQWTTAGVDLTAAGVQPGMRIKLLSGSTLLGAKYSGNNGIVNGTSFYSSGVDFNAMGVEVGMTINLTGIGDFAITAVTDASNLMIEDTGVSQSGVTWEIQVRDEVTWDGFEIISIIDAGHLELEQTGLSGSGLTYEISRAETFDGTEIVTPNIDSNWKLVADGTNSPKPADGDIVHFNDRAFYNTTEKQYQNCTLNVVAAGTETPNLAGVFISAGFNGNIGSSSVPLEINCQNKDIVIDGECNLYLKLSAGPDTDAGCGRLVVNNEKANVYVSSLLNNATNACLYDLLICLKGYLWIQDNCAVNKVVSANYNSSVDGDTGIENVRDNTPCSVTAVKGELIWRSKIDQLELFDAEFSWGDDAMSEVTDNFCNLLTIYSKSGQFLWQMADTGQSLIKKFILYAGNLIASKDINSGYRKIIGTGTEISELWPEATADLNSSSNNVLIAEGSKLESHGGTLIASSGSLLGW